MLHLLGNVDNLIKSDISSTVLNVSFEGSEEGRGKRHYLSLGLSVLKDQFHCNPQTLPITGCFVDDIRFVHIPGERPSGPILGARADVAPTSPPVHLRIHDFYLIGVELLGMVEAAGINEPRFLDG